jgi:hypothetical protein
VPEGARQHCRSVCAPGQLQQAGVVFISAVLRIRDVYLFRIPESNFSIPDPGSKRFLIRICIKEFEVFLALDTVFKLSEKFSGMFIPGPDFFHPGSRGQKAPDRGSQVWIRNTALPCKFFPKLSF